MSTLRQFGQFVAGSLRLILRARAPHQRLQAGGLLYYAWVGLLLAAVLVGFAAYLDQLEEGLITTSMRDQVSWAFYIGNFTFLVGVAAAAVLLVIPAYVYQWKPIKEVAILGELLAISAIAMCGLFVWVDIGRPDRAWHLIPSLGRLNLPSSLLAWDVIVLNGYLVLNAHICGYLLYVAYLGRKPTKLFYVPFVFIAIAWALSIHTVTAFLYVGLGGRPFWNTAILGPRFLCFSQQRCRLEEW